MKIAKVLMVVLAVSLCCTAVNAQDDCSTALSVTCGGNVVLDPASDSTPSATGWAGSCSVGICSGFTAACFDAAIHCPAGQTCSWTPANDTWATFVAGDVSARFQTDLNSIGTDSEFVIYAVDQADVCDDVGWTELGCSGDDSPLGCCNGDLSIGGLTVGDTYLVRMGHWGNAYSGSYQLDVSCPTVGTVCGDGIVSFVPGQEECDGDDNSACEVSCESDCSCTPDVCGNGILGTHATEECDGDDKDACLLLCEADCTCAPVPTPMLPKWGLVGLALMLILGGAAVFGRGRMGVQQA